jgi:hypothetical protein
VTTLIRSAYLLGHTRIIGWWYYFPAAFLFKTPTATLLAILFVPIGLFATRKLAEKPSDVSEPRLTPMWSVIAVALAPLVYFGAALTTNLNLGLRHILPVYPFIFIALGTGFAAIVRRRPMPAKLIGGAIALLLLVETAAAYPNYLAFFNFPSGGSRGGLRLLGDSNLDWGQDLPALANWQQHHPGTPLYFAYFGTADPSAYHLDYTNLIGGYPFAPTGNTTGPGVIALSATNVQAIYWSPQLVEAYVNVLAPEAAGRLRSLPEGPDRDQAMADALRHVDPLAVINGTIYLYEVPPKK